MKKLNRVGTAVAALALLATGSTGVMIGGSTAGAARSQPALRFLLEAALSTQYQMTNAETSEVAAKAAATVINKQGGVLGKKVVLTFVNDGGTPTTAVTKLESAINSSTKPGIYLEADASAESSAVLPILKQSKIVSFNQSPTTTSGNPKIYPYNFDISPSTTNYADAFVPYVKAHDATSVAVFHGNDAYGTAIGKSMVETAKQAGLKVTDTVAYKVTGLTFTATLEAVQATHPAFLYLDGYGAPSGYMLEDLQKIGWSVPLLADDSFSVSPPVTTAPPTGQLGTTLEKNLKFQTFASGVYRPPSQEPKNVETMLTAMKRQGKLKSSLLYGYWYDAVILGSYGARAAKTTTTGPKLAKAIQNLKPGGPPTGLFPAYHYSAVSHSPNVPASAFEFVKPSKLVTGLFGAPSSTG